jgi:hypothetical protein
MNHQLFNAESVKQSRKHQPRLLARSQYLPQLLPGFGQLLCGVFSGSAKRLYLLLDVFLL